MKPLTAVALAAIISILVLLAACHTADAQQVPFDNHDRKEFRDSYVQSLKTYEVEKKKALLRYCMAQEDTYVASANSGKTTDQLRNEWAQTIDGKWCIDTGFVP